MSRCQIYDFNRITIADMIDHLEYVAKQEGYTTERTALNVIAMKADGAMRDALSIFDQVAASSRGNITYQETIANLNVLDAAYYSRLVDCFVGGDVPNSLLIYKEIRDNGFDAHFFINGLGSYLRDLMVALSPATQSLLDYDDETKAKLIEQASRCTPQFFYSAMSLCNSADLNYRTASNKNFLVELLLIKLCQLLSPSPSSDGVGEGRLKPIAVTSAPTQQPVAQAQPAETKLKTATPTTAVQQPISKPREVKSPIQQASTRPNIPGRAPRLSLNGMPETVETVTESQLDNSPTMSEPFTDEALKQAWLTFGDKYPTEKILINTMRAGEPQPLGNGMYQVMVETDIQADLLAQFMRDITCHCRNAVKNSSVTFSVKVNEGVPSPHVWNEREVLAHMLEKPAVKEFITKLKLTIR